MIPWHTNFTINYVGLRQPFHWHAHDFVGLFLIFNSTQPAFNAAKTNTERKTVPIFLITKNCMIESLNISKNHKIGFPLLLGNVNQKHQILFLNTLIHLVWWNSLITWNKNGQLGDITIKLSWVAFEFKFENPYHNQKPKNLPYDGGNKNSKTNTDK